MPETGRLARPLDLLLGANGGSLEARREQALVVERPVVRRELGEVERPEQHPERLTGPDGVRGGSVVLVLFQLRDRAAKRGGERLAALDDLAPATELDARHRLRLAEGPVDLGQSRLVELEGGVDAGGGPSRSSAAAERQPRAEADLRDLQVAVPQAPVAHGA